MFNAFERGETLSEGTGLGLNICKQIANTLEEGDLNYISSKNGGANFELTFVLHSVDEDDATSLLTDDFELLQNLKILLVEDTPILRMVASKILSQNGAIVTEAEDGIIGLNQAGTGDFDLVITDIMMPNCDGYELTTKLREQGFANPIIGVTAATVGSEAERLISCGANAVLPKPLTLLNITEELKKLKVIKV
jgi:CheY-like chemotaxis protein